MVFELLALTTGVSILAWSVEATLRNGRNRRWRRAFSERDWPLLEKMARELLPRVRTPPNQARIRLALAHALLMQERPADAVAVLDPALAASLPGREMATWSSNRAYMLALCGRLDEADDELDGAEVIVGDDEALEGRLLNTCVLGNRGLVRLKRGRLEEAETLIHQAIDLTQGLLSEVTSSEQRRGCAEWQAERFLWLADLAALRADPALERAHLAESARGEGPFAEKARRRLGDVAAADATSSERRASSRRG